VDTLAAARLCLLVTYRPKYQHAWGSKACYTQLRLDPLSPTSARDLLLDLVGAHASLPPLTRLLLDRTQGNPFFLEGSIQTLVETRVLVGARGAYALARALPQVPIPASVQAVLAARIDRLPSEDRQLLQTAPGIGSEVS
jgi:predicted ATPase